MTTDQADILREESRAPHAVFHQFMLLLGKSSPDSHFFFFEGSEDPAFYIGLILAYLDGREYHEFVCNGRQSVIKVNNLCSRDGRAFDRTLYFIDKDHCDLINPKEILPNRIFQTDVAVGTKVTPRPPRRSVRAGLPHTAPASGM
jgi:hypothetical protein